MTKGQVIKVAALFVTLSEINQSIQTSSRFPILKRAFKASMPVFEGSALQQASGTPTASSVAASGIADSLARDACSHLFDSKKKDSKKKTPLIPEDILELSRSIGLNDLCWMHPPKSPENFAHLCVVIQAGQGEDVQPFPFIV
jgi:hypothetical protein